jgi:hypothetical protein
VTWLVDDESRFARDLAKSVAALSVAGTVMRVPGGIAR